MESDWGMLLCGGFFALFFGGVGVMLLVIRHSEQKKAKESGQAHFGGTSESVCPRLAGIADQRSGHKEADRRIHTERDGEKCVSTNDLLLLRH